MYGRKILIVEDHQKVGKLGHSSKKSTLDVLEAGSLKTAFSLISDNQIAAIVTELKLSDGDGFSLLGQLKNMAWNAHRFCYSLWNYEFRYSGHEDGCGGFLDKACHCKRSDRGRARAAKMGPTTWPRSLGSFRANRSISKRGHRSLAAMRAFSLVERVAPYSGNVLISAKADQVKRLSPAKFIA